MVSLLKTMLGRLGVAAVSAAEIEPERVAAVTLGGRDLS